MLGTSHAIVASDKFNIGQKMEAAGPKLISPEDRMGHSLLAVVLLAYGAVGLYYDDIYVPGKRSKGIHFHGTAAWIVFGAFVCASLNLAFVFGDHYDPKGSGRYYHVIARTTQVVGWILFAGAVVCQVTSIGTSRW